MKKLLLGLLLGLGMVAGMAYASVSLPPSVKKGDLLMATSTTQLVRLATSTQGSVLWMNNNVPQWTATSTLALTSDTAWTLGSGLIYNATSTDLVGIGTITPTTTLFVQGKGGTNPFAIASSTGTQLVVVDQAGNVGIGTTTPLARLSVVGAAGNNDILDIASSTSASILKVTALGNVNIATLTATSLVGTDASKNLISLTNSADLAAALSDETGTGLVVFSNSPRFTTNSAVWITGTSGATQPLILFHPTAGSVSLALDGITADRIFTFPNLNGTAALLENSQTFTGTKTFSNATYSALFTGGNVGIGTTSPGYLLHAYNSSSAFDIVAERAGGAKVGLYASTASGIVGTLTTHDLGFTTSGGNPQMTLQATTGNVGIGTTSPLAKLDVYGTAGNNNIVNFASSSNVSVLQITAGSQVLIGTASRLTIPQGTTPTLSAAGDIGVDLSNGGLLSFYGNGRENLNATSTKTMTIVNPTATEDNDFGYFDVPITITKVVCTVRQSDTSSVTFSLPHSTNRSTATANVIASTVCTGTSTPQTITSFSDATLGAGEVLWATTSATTLASTTMIQIYFKYDN